MNCLHVSRIDPTLIVWAVIVVIVLMLGAGATGYAIRNAEDEP